MTNDESKQVGTAVGLPMGTQVGKYKVCERLGIGGQAIVYKGYDGLLDRYVAIKQVSTHLAADPKFLERFRREAQILAKLGAEQNAIVTIHDLIEDERGLFIVMEYVSGSSLETILNDTPGPVEPKAALQIVWRLAAALNAVHAAGIIHRDIKPGNILVSEGLRPKITDFGVAVSVTGQTSMVLGTTKYMAPELFSGGVADGRVDEYSLGFIAYEMLVGRPKFNEIFADVIRDKHSEALRWMKWHGNDSAAAPPLHEVNPAVAKPLSDIVARMIAKNPDDRFASMEELGRAIKTAFSPRARGAAESAPAQAPRRREPALIEVRSAAPAVAGLGQDEVDEFEISSAPPTAPLPKRKLAWRTKLILASAVVVAFIALCVIAVVWGSAIGAAILGGDRKAAARDSLNSAMKLYDDRNFAGAQAKFKEVSSGFAGTAEAAKAGVMVHLSAAQQLVVDGKFEDAAAEEKIAEEALKNEETARKDSKDFSDWADQRHQELKSFDSYRVDAWTFDTAMKNAQGALDRGEFAVAMGYLTKGQVAQLLPSPERDARKKELEDAISIADFKSQVAKFVKAGDALAGKGKYPEASKEYASALKLIDDKEKVPQALPSAELAALKKDVEDKDAKATSTSDYESWMLQAKNAKDSGDKQAEAEALDKAYAVRPSEELAARIKALKVGVLLEKGAEAAAAGKPDEAQKVYAEVLKLDPGNKEAEEAKAQLEQASQRQTLIAAGDLAKTAGRLADAMAKYEEASKIRQDADLDAKIIDCRYRIQVADANRLAAAKKWAEAEAAYQKAKEIKPEAAAEVDALVLAARQQQQYEQLMAQGDAALKEKQWVKAVELYQKAQALSNTPEITERINSARYSQYISNGKDAMEQKDYQGALASFKLAKGFKDTDEVKQLIKQAEQAIKDNK